MATTGDYCQLPQTINGLSDLPLGPHSTDLALLIGTRTQRPVESAAAYTVIFPTSLAISTQAFESIF